MKELIEKQSENLGSSRRSFEQALEKCQANVKWMQDNMDKITTWLEAMWQIIYTMQSHKNKQNIIGFYIYN